MEYIDDLKRSKIPFIMYSTTFTKTIYVDNRTYYYTANGKLKQRELNLIRIVKAYAESQNFKINVDRSKINYIKVNNFKSGVYKKDIYEIDLNAAYWRLAYKYGYITKDIYYKGLNLNDKGELIKPVYNSYGNISNYVSKMSRLIALGNLAKSKTIFKYDGEKYHAPEKEYSTLTENVFFKVSSETDAIMKILSIIAGKDYLFYWVDAIFVKSKEAMENICDYLTNELEFEFKVMKIHKLKKANSYIMLWDKKNIDKDGNMIPRPYVFASTPAKQLNELLDINKNLIYKEHEKMFLNDLK